jgi:hypothetical protein
LHQLEYLTLTFAVQIQLASAEYLTLTLAEQIQAASAVMTLKLADHIKVESAGKLGSYLGWLLDLFSIS